MSTSNLVCILILIVILTVGIVIKVYTRKKLKDLDGVDAMFIVKEEDKHTIENRSRQ